MSRISPPRILLALSLLLFGGSLFALNTSPAEKAENQIIIITDQNRGLFKKEDIVVIEPNKELRVDHKTKNIVLTSYRKRRTSWGSSLSFAAEYFKTPDYEPNFVVDDYNAVYGGSNSPGIGVTLNIKHNYSFYSLGFEVGLGSGKKTSDEAIADSTLQTYDLRLGARLSLDALFENTQWFAPYITGGVYSVYYSEKQSSTSANGTTEPALYGSAGVMFDIDWIDPTSENSYFEAGIENFFLYAEVTQFLASQNSADRNFSSLGYKVGFSIEF